MGSLENIELVQTILDFILELQEGGGLGTPGDTGA